MNRRYGKLELDWGPVADVYFDVVSSVNLNMELTSPECSFTAGTDAWVAKLVLTLCLPVFVGLGMLFMGGAFAVGIQSNLSVWLGSKNMRQLGFAAIRAWFQALVLLYLPLTAAALSVFGCRKDETGRWVLDADPVRSCYNAAWWSGLFPIGLVATLVYAVAIPGGVVGVLAKKRKTMDELAFSLRFGFLVGRFAWFAWWFEAAIMGRKLAVVLCMTFFTTENAKANAAVLALLATWGHLVYARPYLAPFHSGLAILVLAATTCVLYAGTFADFGFRRFGVIAGISINVLAILVGNGLDLYRIFTQERKIEEEEFFQPDTFAMASMHDEERDASALHSFAGGSAELELDVVGSGMDSVSSQDVATLSTLDHTSIGTSALVGS